MKAMLLREAMSPLEAGGWGDVNLEQGVVSPVRLDSSTDRSVDWEEEEKERGSVGVSTCSLLIKGCKRRLSW